LCKDIAEYIKVFKLGKDEKCVEMLAVFADPIIKKKRAVLEEIFRRVIHGSAGAK
jgi:hypothetical protein